MRSFIVVVFLAGCAEIPVPNSDDALHQRAVYLVNEFNSTYHQNLAVPRIYYGELDSLVLAHTWCVKRYGTVSGCNITFNTNPTGGIDESYSLSNTLPHELGHYACAMLENGDASLHDECWRKYATEFGLSHA